MLQGCHLICKLLVFFMKSLDLTHKLDFLLVAEDVGLLKLERRGFLAVGPESTRVASAGPTGHPD
jgi:hypothetical protein